MRSLRISAGIATVVAAAAFGMILTGSLHITPTISAARTPAPVSAPPAAPATATGARGLALPSFPDVADNVLNSVVSITSREIVQTSGRGNSPFGQGDPFEFFFGPRRGQPQQRSQIAGGSGFIVSSDGEILTNNHVVAGAQKIQVKLRDGEIFTAHVLGTDPATDVALIKVDAKHNLPALSLGDSGRLRVGEWVMAVGNPLNFEGTVTVGVISGKGRGGLSGDPNTRSFENFLQTDAAINFGNSGGPLVNEAGQVVGINTAMIQPAQNIGFAIPINTARAILPQLKSKGKVTRSMLGVRIGPVDQDHMEAFHLPSMNGAFVESVDVNGPAGKAGVEHGDTIVRVDETDVKETRDLIDYVSSRAPGSKVKLTVLRDGKPRTLSATLTEREASPSEDTEQSASKGSAQGRLGVTATNLTPDIRRELGVPSGVSGIVLESVNPTSPAAEEGLAEGDVITEINGAPVSSVSQFRSELEKVKKGDYIRLYVRRFAPQEVSRYVVIKPE
jgi:serine protease Do